MFLHPKRIQARADSQNWQKPTVVIGHAPLEQNNEQPGQQPQPAPAPTVAAGNGSTAAAPVLSVLPAFADGNIQVTEHLDNDGGKITANGMTELSVGRQLDNQAKLHVGRLTANGQEVDNRQGSILANGTKECIHIADAWGLFILDWSQTIHFYRSPPT